MPSPQNPAVMQEQLLHVLPFAQAMPASHCSEPSSKPLPQIVTGKELAEDALLEEREE